MATLIQAVNIKTEIGVEVNVVETVGFSAGESETESTTKSITAAMEIPDSHKMTVAIVANKYKTNVPYTATLEKRFYDGTKTKQKISGMFKGVSIDEVKVKYGVIEPLQSISNSLFGEQETVRRRRRRATFSCDPAFAPVDEVTYEDHNAFYDLVFGPDYDYDSGIPGKCADNAQCTKDGENFVCVCKDGFQGDGEVSKSIYILFSLIIGRP